MIYANTWFVSTIQDLAAGRSPISRNNFADTKFIERSLQTLEHMGMSRISRKGWNTVNHPTLGMIQWKSGSDFRTAMAFFFLRVNGKMVLRCWPKAGQKDTYTQWISHNPSEDNASHVETFMGGLKNGSNMCHEERMRHDSK